MKNYKNGLKKEMLNALEGLHPSKKMEYHRGECPECNEEDMYLYYSDYKYGRCTNCSHEVGFEYYTEVMGNQIKVYNELKNKIENF